MTATPVVQSPAPIASGVAMVTGTHSCGEVVSPIDTPVGNLVQRRGQVFRCAWDVSDPRIRGTGVSLISADIASDGSVVVWATDLTWNDAGTWVGRATGTKDGAGVHWLTTTEIGTGAYAGLRYTDSETGPGDSWSVDGRIESLPQGPTPTGTAQPGRGSAVMGTGTCHEVLAATPAGPAKARAWVFDCMIKGADPRVAGSQLVLIDADVRADGTASLWGTTVIWNEKGTWDGSWTGVAANGWPSGKRTFSGTLRGSDAYRGQELRVAVTSTNGLDLVISGSIAGAE